jgi:hypothetical protein
MIQAGRTDDSLRLTQVRIDYQYGGPWGYVHRGKLSLESVSQGMGRAFGHTDGWATGYGEGYGGGRGCGSAYGDGEGNGRGRGTGGYAYGYGAAHGFGVFGGFTSYYFGEIRR